MGEDLFAANLDIHLLTGCCSGCRAAARVPNDEEGNMVASSEQRHSVDHAGAVVAGLRAFAVRTNCLSGSTDSWWNSRPTKCANTGDRRRQPGNSSGDPAASLIGLQTTESL